MKKIFLILIIPFLFTFNTHAEDGYRLWLRYDLISNAQILNAYRSNINGIISNDTSATSRIAFAELNEDLKSMLGKSIKKYSDVNADGLIILGTNQNSKIISSIISEEDFNKINDEGFIIKSANYNHKKVIIIAAKKDIGVLYGVFNFLRLMQTHQSIDDLAIFSSPKIKLRLLNHWDNLDRTSERNYAGFSIWDWHRLPGYIDQRYYDYARADASIGINGAVLTNVNANAWVLTSQYLEKVKALADVFRPYGVRVYLTARFSAPVEIGGLKTADPLDQNVRIIGGKKK